MSHFSAKSKSSEVFDSLRARFQLFAYDYLDSKKLVCMTSQWRALIIISQQFETKAHHTIEKRDTLDQP